MVTMLQESLNKWSRRLETIVKGHKYLNNSYYRFEVRNMVKNEKIINEIKRREYTYAILRNDEVIYSFNGSGIGAVYKTIKVDPKMITGSEIYDTYVGKAVAMLLSKYGAKSVYGEEMTQLAIDVFMKYGIDYRYGKLVPMIYNHDESAECPFEMAVKEIDDLEKAQVAVFKTMSDVLSKQNN